MGSLCTRAAVLVGGLLFLGLTPEERPARDAALPHPHFPKTLICAIPKGPTITVKHLTVTFDAEGPLR